MRFESVLLLLHHNVVSTNGTSIPIAVQFQQQYQYNLYYDYSMRKALWLINSTTIDKYDTSRGKGYIDGNPEKHSFISHWENQKGNKNRGVTSLIYPVNGFYGLPIKRLVQVHSKRGKKRVIKCWKPNLKQWCVHCHSEWHLHAGKLLMSNSNQQKLNIL